jgi:hypothetical protein
MLEPNVVIYDWTRPEMTCADSYSSSEMAWHILQYFAHPLISFQTKSTHDSASYAI